MKKIAYRFLRVGTPPPMSDNWSPLMKLKIVLLRLMKEQNLSQAMLARLTGVPPQTINNWLNGQEPRNLTHLKKVSDHLHVSLDYLLFDVNFKDQTSWFYSSNDFDIEVKELIIKRRDVSMK